MRSDYKICPDCGAALDIGEKCDCKQEQQEYNKVAVCVYPHKYGCKGCEYNNIPTLYDGGCLLLTARRTEQPKTGRKRKQPRDLPIKIKTPSRGI